MKHRPQGSREAAPRPEPETALRRSQRPLPIYEEYNTLSPRTPHFSLLQIYVPGAVQEYGISRSGWTRLKIKFGRPRPAFESSPALFPPPPHPISSRRRYVRMRSYILNFVPAHGAGRWSYLLSSLVASRTYHSQDVIAWRKGRPGYRHVLRENTYVFELQHSPGEKKLMFILTAGNTVSSSSSFPSSSIRTSSPTG